MTQVRVSLCSDIPSYCPAHAENRMRGEGDVVAAREDYFQRASDNLRSLLHNRYDWMNRYVGPGSLGLDVGCGTGLSREFIRCRRLFLSDFVPRDFLDVAGVNALQLPFAAGSFDFLVASNVIHHLSSPLLFFEEARRVLRAGGFLLIHEVHASLLFRAVLRMMRHEGYSFDVNVFDCLPAASDPADPWSGNNAVPRLLFDDHAAFLRSAPGWEILRDERFECLMFLNSGGVTAKTAYLPLPRPLLRAVERLDEVLVRLAPNVFALGRRIALRSK